MINYIKGNVISIKQQSISVLLQQIGISFELFTPRSEVFSLGKESLIYTYLHWNQEQGPSLYGFSDEFERQIFILVISCSGIGPKMGLAILSQMTPNDFIAAINSQDTKSLSSISGIGAKKAEQIIVNLKHKVSNIIESGLLTETNSNLKDLKNISDVLNSLNYSRSEISGAIDYIRSSCSDKNYSFDQMLRQALSYLSKRA